MPNLLSEIFAYTFQNLSDPAQCAISLKAMKMSINCIIVSQKETKDFVYMTFAPHIDEVLSIYEAGVPDTIMNPLFDFLEEFLNVFPAQIGSEMNEIIARLFAPLEAVLPTLETGTVAHTAVTSFIKLLFRIAQFRTSITKAQTENIANLILGFGPEILTSSMEILITTLEIIKVIIEDTRDSINADTQNQLLHFLFFEGLQNEYPDATNTAMRIIKKSETNILGLVSIDFCANAFLAVTNQMIKSTRTSMREQILEFVTFLAQEVDNFLENIVFPLIRSLSVSEADQEALAGLFASYGDELEFKRAYISFCDDVAYILME